MRLVFHRRVYSDIDAVLRYYEQVGGSRLANDFTRELERALARAAERPEAFAARDGKNAARES